MPIWSNRREPAPGSIRAEHLADGSITLSKAAKSLRKEGIKFNHVEVNVIGTTATDINKTMSFNVTNLESYKYMAVVAEMKSSSGDSAYLEIYIDGTLSEVITTDEPDWVIVESSELEIPFSIGKKQITYKMRSSISTGISYNRQLDLHVVRA